MLFLSEAGEVTVRLFRYHVPDASTKSIPTVYVEEEEPRPGGDGAKWESERFMASLLKFGAKDAAMVKNFLMHLVVFYTSS